MSKTIADLAVSEDREDVERNLIYVFTTDALGRQVPVAKLINFTLPDDNVSDSSEPPEKAQGATETSETVDSEGTC